MHFTDRIQSTSAPNPRKTLVDPTSACCLRIISAALGPLIDRRGTVCSEAAAAATIPLPPLLFLSFEMMGLLPRFFEYRYLE
jgi:hypothetical protein